MSVSRDDQPGSVHPTGVKHVQLFEKRRRLDDNPVSDDRGDLGIEDSRGNQLECEGFATDDNGVACVMSALVADNHVHLLGEKVGQFALALIAPLGPDHYGHGHAWASLIMLIASPATLPRYWTQAQRADWSATSVGHRCRRASGEGDDVAAVLAVYFFDFVPCRLSQTHQVGLEAIHLVFQLDNTLDPFEVQTLRC